MEEGIGLLRTVYAAGRILQWKGTDRKLSSGEVTKQSMKRLNTWCCCFQVLLINWSCCVINPIGAHHSMLESRLATVPRELDLYSPYLRYRQPWETGVFATMAISTVLIRHSHQRNDLASTRSGYPPSGWTSMVRVAIQYRTGRTFRIELINAFSALPKLNNIDSRSACRWYWEGAANPELANNERLKAGVAAEDIYFLPAGAEVSWKSGPT